MAGVILSITTLGIVVSFIPALIRIVRSFELGMYLMLVFCMIIASAAGLSKINFASLIIGAQVAFVVFGSMLVYSMLASYFAQMSIPTLLRLQRSSVLRPWFP